MKFTQTTLQGAYIIEIERIEDERGFFARSFCQKEFEQHNIPFRIIQSNISYNQEKGTLRGLHYQATPYQEAKLISCLDGALYDVIIDLRPESATYCQWTSVELLSQNHTMLYVPQGFANGFQTLRDGTIVLYHMSEFYHPELACGIRWQDSRFDIPWPLPVTNISVKDQAYPDFD
jgi:dTDP-4-dehydrorhamnose 3,5-epimerase